MRAFRAGGVSAARGDGTGEAMKRSVGIWALLVAALCLGGCAHRRVKVDNQERPYTIGREDVVDVSVWRDADLSRVIPVRPDGFITLPICGDVQAAGKTPAELADAIRQKLAPYVQEPKVAVIVREVNSARVYVTGEVARPGAYPLRGRVSVLQAIALAGGFSAFANTDGILVIRQGDKGQQIPVRYSDLVAADRPDDAQGDFPLQPGDTVVVP